MGGYGYDMGLSHPEVYSNEGYEPGNFSGPSEIIFPVSNLPQLCGQLPSHKFDQVNVRDIGEETRQEMLSNKTGYMEPTPLEVADSEPSRWGNVESDSIYASDVNTC